MGLRLKAYMKMETVEHFAKIALVTHLLGRAQPLGEKEVEKLHEVRQRYSHAASSHRPMAGTGRDGSKLTEKTVSSQP